MKSRTIVKLTILLTLAAIATWLLTGRGQRFGQEADKRIPTGVTKMPSPANGRESPEKGPPGSTDAEKGVFIQSFGESHDPPDLSRKTVFERISAAKPSMDIQAQMLPDEKVENITDAYKRLMKGAVFMDGSEPTWGVEDSDYFYFSGSRLKQAAADAYFFGYAIKRDNGRVYRWVRPRGDK